MDAVRLLVLGGAAACVWVTYRALTQDIRFKSRVRRKLPSRIADVRHGQHVKLVGKVVAGDEQAEAPLSDRTCVFVHAWLERLTVTARVDGVMPIESWVDGGETHGGCDFLLEDESGRALVKLSGDFEPMALLRPSSYVDYLDREVGVRGKEAVVLPGDRIAVVGTVTRTTAVEGGGPFRASQAADTEVVLSGSRSAPVVLVALEPLSQRAAPPDR